MATLSSGGNSLSFHICQENDCEAFKFYETTGTYTTTNSGGWAVLAGAGATVNFVPGDAIQATLTVTLPDGTICPAITLYPTFPDTTGLLSETIDSTDLGLTGSLPDGVYSATYQVDISNVSSQTVVLSVTQSFLLSCTVQCCVNKLIAKVAEEECDCESVAIKNEMLAFALYQSLQSAGACGNLTSVANLLARLQKLCSAVNCGCS